MGQPQRLQQRPVQRDHAAGCHRQREADLAVQREQVGLFGIFSHGRMLSIGVPTIATPSVWSVLMNEKNAGLSLAYRFRWRLTWLLLHIAGPATLPDHLDPRRRM